MGYVQEELAEDGQASRSDYRAGGRRQASPCACCHALYLFLSVSGQLQAREGVARARLADPWTLVLLRRDAALLRETMLIEGLPEDDLDHGLAADVETVG